VSPLSDRLRPVSDRLSGLRASLRRLYALDGAARVLLAALGFVALTFLADWSLDLPSWLRLLLLAGGVGLLAWIVTRRVALPLSVGLSDDDLALLIERKHPELEDRLVSAIQLARAPEAPDRSPELVAAVVEDAGKLASSLDFTGVLVARHVGKVAGWALAGFLVLGGLALAFPVYASTYAARLAGGSRKWPQQTHLKVLDFAGGRRVCARGEDLTIAVAYEGRRPRQCFLRYEFASGEEGTERMNPLAGDRFQATFSRLSGPFTFTVEGNDDTTSEHRVEVVNQPTIELSRLWFEYPAYMRKANTPSDQPEPMGNIVAPIHTKVRFEAVASEDLESAVLKTGLRGKEEAAPLQVTPVSDGHPRAFAGVFAVTEPLGEYSFELKAKNGLSNRDPIRFALKGVEDRAPDIVVRDPLGDEFVTDVCARPLEIEVRDDHGIARVALEWRTVSQHADRQKDWTALDYGREQNSRDYGEALIRSEHVMDVGTLGLQAGDHVELRFRAEDYKDVGGRNVRTSKVYKLSVVSTVQLEKELQDAIEKIKTQLKNQKNRQESFWTRTGRLLANYGRGELLSPEQQGEVRQAGLDQNDVTSKLDALRKEIRLVMRRGVYNKIFNESAAQKLQGAVDELAALVGEEGRDGVSRLAASRLDQAAKLRTGPERTTAFREAQQQQSGVAAGIQRALEYLDKWSSYQEVIRITRELIDWQKRVNDGIKKVGK
jgi:hypothetical protein